jgi:hypothetical protein
MRTVPILALLAAAACTPRSSAVAKEPSVDERIEYYRKRVEENPRLYPVWVQLGDAYLDKAREVSDPSWLAKAHDAAARSMELQETYGAYHLKARLAGHSHRFADAQAWARKGETAAVTLPDYQLTALQVEALVGLGRTGEAKALLPTVADVAAIDDFFVAAAYARIANEEQHLDEAAQLYLRAGELAWNLGSKPHTAWAEAMAGGMLLDGGNFAAALPHLDKSARLGGCAEEAIHRAEVLAGTKHERDALAAYEKYLVKTPDPGVHHAAFKLAKQLGDDAAARRHYAAAEQGYRKVVAANEIYTLGSLAQLLLDGNGDAREALALAEKNFEYKRDREAKATLDEAKARTQRAAMVH